MDRRRLGQTVRPKSYQHIPVVKYEIDPIKKSGDCRAVEGVRDMLAEQGVKPDNSWIPAADMGNDTSCNTNFPMK